MKFVHISDLHFDIPFAVLNRSGLAETRRLEQRQVLKRIIEYVKINNIPMLFICGDLYEHQYVRETTIEYINNLFKQIPNTQIFIISGNHDPYLNNSYYNKFSWNENVKIFKSNIEKYIFNNQIDIYGYGFEDFYMKKSKTDLLKIENKNKFNILLTHGSLDGGKYDENLEYNPMTKKEVRELPFDYIGLGHIHKLSYKDEENQKYVYPGSTVSLGFDELGKHGMIVGDINLENKKVSVEFIPMDVKEFVEKEILIDEIMSKEELIEYINELKLEENKYYKIILTGKRNFEIDIYELYKYIKQTSDNSLIIKIKDFTKIKYDLEKIAKEETLKGIFVRNMLQKIEKNLEEKEVVEKAIEIGLEAFE